jgi:LCP family protein required for cell wall assembly
LPRQPLEYRRIFKRVLWGLLAFVLVTLVGLIVVQQQVARDVALPDVRESRPMRKPLLAPMNILLAGVDSRPDHPEEGIRSDSLILLHLDPLGGWANLLAIPRDSVAEIPGYGTSKINAAFAHGHDNAAEIFGRDTPQLAAGAAIAADTAEQFLGLREQGARIDYMATVDFDGFAKMIDAIGGIDVDVPRTIIDDAFPTPDFGYMRIEIPAGRQHFDGERALQYVRTRHADSDFGRAERQQQVLRAMVERIRSRALPMKIISAYRLLRATGAAIHTTVPVGRPDAFLLGLAMLRLDPAEIGNYRIEPETVGVQFSGSDLIWDAADVQAVARQALSRPSQAQENATIQVQNSAGVGGLAGSVTQTLADDSFTTQAPATGEPAARSVIIDFTGKPRTRERLQEALGGMPVEVRPDGAAPADVDILVVLGDDYAEYVAER